jgi:hypothetical protein
MKVRSILFALILLLFIGCENETQKLNVLFVNKDSEFAITDLYVKDAKGNWSTSFIPEGKELAKDQYFEFSLYLTKGEKREYYIKVSDNGVVRSLVEGPIDDSLTILSWSSPTRYVYITVRKDGDTNLPVVTYEEGWDFWDNDLDIDDYEKVSW